MNKSVYIIQHNITDSVTIENRIKTLGDWIKYFDNSFLLRSDLKAKDIYEKISVDFEKSNILIMEITSSNYWGRMDVSLWKFLKE
ncbi:hypothetical protein [uncultured Acetobacteroides sp.]|uniref:hypothetical protein n=1 Tax=uncultured Acetobacteroides sp. TaxID=1760811 RepID=UPI0029F4FE28|nr:hypothetical protein [uncultured Acetobacteroides sp.]